MTDPAAPPVSCRSCPSFLATEKVVTKFKKSIGAPVCGRYGHVLGRPGASRDAEEKLAKHFASKCPSFGKPLPPAPEEERLLIALPDPDAINTLPEGDNNRLAVDSCSTCSKFVPDRVVVEELGWTTPLCAAKGKLLRPDRLRREAASCEYRAYGINRRSTVGIHILPEYEDAFAASRIINPIKEFLENKTKIIDPQEYETDRPVNDAAKAAGIRAWRKIVDPYGSGNVSYLPIYDPSFFSKEEQDKIPKTGDDEHPELYADHFGGVYNCAIAWRELDETPALWGPAGTGKTELFRHLAWLMSLPFERFSITRSTELDELAGKPQFDKEKGTYFQYGRFPQAWMKPSVICVDEPNVGPSDVWQFFRPLTDNSKQLVLDMNKGERVKRDDNCYLGMAMNPAWDPRNIGAEQIGDADVRRLWHVSVPLPPKEIEREIIKDRCHIDGWDIDDDRLTHLEKIAEDIRALAKEGTVPVSWGVAQQIKTARALRWFDWVTAYRRAVTDFLEPEASEAILGLVRTVVGV